VRKSRGEQERGRSSSTANGSKALDSTCETLLGMSGSRCTLRQSPIAPVCASLSSVGGFYRPGTYLLAKMVLDALLLRVIPVFIFSAPFYPMVRLNSAIHSCGWQASGPCVCDGQGAVQS
jgi:hypothetical protein